MLPRKLSACTNSVYQALFPPPPRKSLGMRLNFAKNKQLTHVNTYRTGVHAYPTSKSTPLHIVAAQNCVMSMATALGYS